MSQNTPKKVPGVSYDAEGNVVFSSSFFDEEIQEGENVEPEKHHHILVSQSDVVTKTQKSVHGFFSVQEEQKESSNRVQAKEVLSATWNVITAPSKKRAKKCEKVSQVRPSEPNAHEKVVPRARRRPSRGSMHLHSPRFISTIKRTLQSFENSRKSPVRFFYESTRFSITFAGAFAVLFIALNFGSFSQLFRAELMPHEAERAEVALTQVAEPILRHYQLAIPRLPEAGDNTVLPLLSRITPPDNRIIIPKIGKNIPLVEVTDASLRREDWKTFEKDIQEGLRFGVVRYPGTAIPGQVGNSFITGHSSYQPWDSGKYKDVFALLPSLEVGDEYYIFFNGRLHYYRIAEKYEVKPTDVTVLDQPRDQYMSTLMTCTPIGTNLRRLILRSQEIDPVTDMPFLVKNIREFSSGVREWGEELPI